MAQRPGGVQIVETPDIDDPIARAMQRLLPPHIGPSRMERIFDEYENEPFRQPMPAQHMLADAGGDSSPAMMEIARMLAGRQGEQQPARIDLSGMPGPRSRGEVSRMDLSQPRETFEPQTVNRDAKRDSLAAVDVSSLPKGIAREALGQALLLGYGDDIEGYLTGRHADDIRRERNAFGDENPATSLGSYVGGMAAGGAGPKIVKYLAGLGRGSADQVEPLPPRFEPDLRQAMRNADDVEAGARSADDAYDALQRLLSNPEARADIKGRPLELSPADIFTAMAGAPGGEMAGQPSAQVSEHDTSAMSPIDRLRMEVDLASAGRGNATEDEKRANARTNAEFIAGLIPGPANVLAARDALQGARGAGEAFGAGDTRAGLMQSALAALSGVGAVTGLPFGRAASNAARGGSSRAGVFVPVEDSRKIEDVLSRRLDDVPLADIYRDTGAFIDPSGKVLREIPDSSMKTGMGRFRPGDEATLGEYADHPIFDAFPQYRDMQVRFTNEVDARGGSPIARTLPEGGAELSLAGGDPRKGIAKVLQYNIARDTGLPRAVRHGRTEPQEAMLDAAQSMRAVQPQGRADLDALAAYVDHMATRRDALLGNIKMSDPKKIPNMIQWEANKSAGNANSRAVSGRAIADPEKLEKTYPYMRRPFYLPRGPGRGMPDFEDMWTLPPEGATPDQLAEFLRAWRTYGAGRPLDR